MVIILIFVVSFVGAPVGLACVMIGAWGLSQNAKHEPRSWPRVLLTVGVVLLVAAAIAYSMVANANFAY